MSTVNCDQLPNDNILVRTIHSTVKGRARYQVHGLYGSETFKKYLGLRLSHTQGILQVNANHWTGNVLVMFCPDFSPNAIALLLQDIVLDYAKDIRKITLQTAQSRKNLPQKLNPVNNQLILASGAICTFALAGALLYRYRLDESILLAIQKLHTPLLDRIMLAITSLSDPLALVLICCGVEFYLLYHHRRQATRLTLATASAIGLNYLLKMLFGRLRPALWERMIHVGQHSFPSGHAMVSMVFYGFISYIFAQQYPQWRKEIFAFSAILILAIGFSRLYLGVHWPTDILAGYAIGLALLIAYPDMSPR